MKGMMEPMGHLEDAASLICRKRGIAWSRSGRKQGADLYGDGATVIPEVSFVMSEADRRCASGDTFTSMSQQQC